VTRIIAGAAGGRRLAVPAGRGTRPTSDRAREGLFATILAIRGPLDGASALDLYAGAGLFAGVIAPLVGYSLSVIAPVFLGLGYSLTCPVAFHQT